MHSSGYNTQLDEKYSENGFEVLQALQVTQSEQMGEDWGVEMEFKPVYTEYDFSGDMIPTHPAALGNHQLAMPTSSQS